MNTTIRLAVFIPTLLFCAVIAVAGLGFGGLTLQSVALAAAIVAVPVALIVWTIGDHKRRRQISEFTDAQD